MDGGTHTPPTPNPLHSNHQEATTLKRTVLLAQATPHGPTSHANHIIATILTNHGLTVDLKPTNHITQLDHYGAIIISSPTRLGRLHPNARRFLHKHHTTLNHIPLALFTTHHHPPTHNHTIERALADTPDIEPITSAHLHPNNTTTITHWAEQLAHELGA